MSRASARGSGKHNSCPTLETERSETQSLGCASRGCDQACRGGGVSGGALPAPPPRHAGETSLRAGGAGARSERCACTHAAL